MTRLSRRCSTTATSPAGGAPVGWCTAKLASVLCGGAVVAICAGGAALLFPADGSSATAMPNPGFAVHTHLPVVMAPDESAAEGLVPEWGEASRLAALLRVHAAMVEEIVPGGYASRVGRTERLIGGHAVTTIAGSPSVRADRVR